MELVAPESALGRLLDAARAREASDLHGQAGKPWRVRIHGRLERLDPAAFPPLGADALAAALAEAFSPELAGRASANREVDAAFRFREDRYRANFSKQLGAQSLSFRIVPQQQAALDELQLPPSLRGILDEPRSLVLLTGPTGQGKSTTARALLQELNLTRALRIITIEDPVEYVFTDAQSQFEQREVGADTGCFADGIRNAMRQDPNVIFIGEIRDRESIWAGMQAAETGHLVVTTLHADSVPQAIVRLREYYPAAEQASVSALLRASCTTAAGGAARRVAREGLRPRGLALRQRGKLPARVESPHRARNQSRPAPPARGEPADPLGPARKAARSRAAAAAGRRAIRASASSPPRRPRGPCRSRPRRPLLRPR